MIKDIFVKTENGKLYLVKNSAYTQKFFQNNNFGRYLSFKQLCDIINNCNSINIKWDKKNLNLALKKIVESYCENNVLLNEQILIDKKTDLVKEILDVIANNSRTVMLVPDVVALYLRYILVNEKNLNLLCNMPKMYLKLCLLKVDLGELENKVQIYIDTQHHCDNKVRIHTPDFKVVPLAKKENER